MTADGDDSSSDEAEPARQAPPAPPAPPARSVEVAARSFRGGGPHEGDPQQRSVVVEGPLTIQVKGGQSYTIMRTPGDDRELAVGFLFTEGLIAGTGDILTLADCLDEENVIQVALAVGPSGDATRNIPVSSSCGMCGREDFEALVAELEPPPPGEMLVTLDTLCSLPEDVRASQELFQATGGSHAAALFDAAGRILVLREDLGRHNALDKVLGHCLLAGIDTAGTGAFLSGRASLEMVIKAARGRIPLVAAVSAPTSAAIDLAERLGITLCGFVRGSEVTVYTHPDRVTAAG